MKIFVTGASGHIGQLVTAELVEAGHQVVGLARNDAGAERVAKQGGDPVVGTVDDTDRLAELAAAADGVVNLAFKHDAGDFGAAVAADRALIGAIADALDGSGKPFLAASGTMMLVGQVAPGEVGTEDTPIDAESAPNPRAVTEQLLLGLAARGVRSAALRLSPTVHGPTDFHGFIPSLIAGARAAGSFGYVGDGSNRWPAVHNLDAAHLIRLALEKEDLPAGIPLHVAAEEGIPFRRIAEAIARGAGVPIESVSQQTAAERYGFVGAFIGLDNPTSSAKTRELLGWQPTHSGLLEDLADGFYFTR
ncbi:SDR family oxidoreductase [Gryllotalpicola ginsengisoli]|uniref:SDR family oxidoreductase n=1 Tax=Gryllotalpicola ginsengisoli TaxID=444608 RepID=UPI0003B32A28|nr:SDR family oxidoreductase [Gryllotalpicola ginsengisoli]